MHPVLRAYLLTIAALIAFCVIVGVAGGRNQSPSAVHVDMCKLSGNGEANDCRSYDRYTHSAAGTTYLPIHCDAYLAGPCVLAIRD